MQFFFPFFLRSFRFDNSEEHVIREEWGLNYHKCLNKRDIEENVVQSGVIRNPFYLNRKECKSKGKCEAWWEPYPKFPDDAFKKEIWAGQCGHPTFSTYIFLWNLRWNNIYYPYTHPKKSLILCEVLATLPSFTSITFN